MDYEPYDSSGTDDDFPPTHQNRIPRGNRVAGNGRASLMSSIPYPRMYGETDMDAQIHQLEQEAYISVLRALKAQADAITWEKEGLITELRKELRLSNEEHRELLSRVNNDEVLLRIREWRQAGGIPTGMISSGQAVNDRLPSPSLSVSRKKNKITQSIHSESFGGPSPSLRVPIMGLKNKKRKSSQAPPSTSSMQMQHPSLGPAGRLKFANQNPVGFTIEPGDASAVDSLIGKRVRTRWPDDNNFYEAIITDYSPAEGCHALVYDVGTANETWEWVNLSEITSGDIQWEGEEPGIFCQVGYCTSGHVMNNRSAVCDNIPGTGSGRGMIRVQSRKGFLLNGVGKKGWDDIQILHTDSLIREVDRVFCSSYTDPVEIEKMKKVLKEHEQALNEAIARLAYISDGESVHWQIPEYSAHLPYLKLYNS